MDSRLGMRHFWVESFNPRSVSGCEFVGISVKYHVGEENKSDNCQCRICVKDQNERGWPVMDLKADKVVKDECSTSRKSRWKLSGKSDWVRQSEGGSTEGVASMGN